MKGFLAEGWRSRRREPARAGGPTRPGLLHVHVLRDGSRIYVRPLQPSDRAQLAARYAALSPATKRARFGSAPEELSERQLDQLLDLDYDERLALAAKAVDEPDQPGVGIARYARCRDDPAVAEAAIIVADEYQHRGIGKALLWDLVAAARARGITTFTATVAWESEPLLDAIRSAGAVVEAAEPGVASVRFRLPDENPS